MSCIGKELVIDAARIPIVDVVDSQDLVTCSAILQVCAFLAYMWMFCKTLFTVLNFLFHFGNQVFNNLAITARPRIMSVIFGYSF